MKLRHYLKMRTLLICAALSCFVFSAYEGSATDSSLSALSSVPSLQEQLKDYCQTYLEALATLYEKNSSSHATARVSALDRGSRMMTFMTNIFQPFDSRFHSSYICRFQIDLHEKKRAGSMTLLLIENKAFAEYTQWKDIQIIDIGEVSHPQDETLYVVVKYLEVDEKYLHLYENRKESPFYPSG